MKAYFDSIKFNTDYTILEIDDIEKLKDYINEQTGYDDLKFNEIKNISKELQMKVNSLISEGKKLKI